MENVEPSRARRQLNPTQPPRGRRTVLLFSVGLNLALLLCLALLTRKSSNATPVTPPSDEPSPISERVIPTRLASRAAHASAWSKLESADLASYAANLRAAGCPQKTVRDILLPLIEEKFERAEAADSERITFWASFSQRQAVDLALMKQEQKKSEVIKELLGFSWTSEGLKQACSWQAANSSGYLDYEHAEKLACIDDRFNTQLSQTIHSHRIDRRLEIYEIWRKEVAEILSAAEFEEFELRGILRICERRSPNLYKAGVTGSELRQLMIFKRDLCNPLPSAFLTSADEVQEPDWIGEQRFNAKARSLLGDNRFLNYLKSSDASIERTLATLQKEHLPRTVALQLFDLRLQSMARAQEIRHLPIRRTEKRTQLAALHEHAIQQITSLPNPKHDELLLNNNQDWLQEIASP